MTSIDEAARLAALIRAQMASVTQQKSSPARSASQELESPPGKADPTTTSAEADDSRGVSAAVLAQVRALSADDAAPRKAFRLFLRSTLARQLARSSDGDASFDHLVDQVMDMMTADEQLNSAIQKAGQHLVELAAQS